MPKKHEHSQNADRIRTPSSEEQGPKPAMPTKSAPERLGPLSMEGLDVEEALKGAMEVTPPERDPEPGDDEDDGMKERMKPTRPWAVRAKRGTVLWEAGHGCQ